MAASSFTKPSLAQFRGCMLGVLLGDTLGFPFEFETKPIKSVSQHFKDLLAAKCEYLTIITCFTKK